MSVCLSSNVAQVQRSNFDQADKSNLVILDLCGGSGSWSAPYRQAGYAVEVFDLLTCVDVRFLTYPGRVHGILAAPPCTYFSLARNGYSCSPEELQDALSIVDACFRLITICQPVWWALENPNGHLRKWLGPPQLTFQPCTYGDPWTKLTNIWGNFAPLTECPVYPSRGSIMSIEHTAAKRAITPPGFARAFYEANS